MTDGWADFEYELSNRSGTMDCMDKFRSIQGLFDRSATRATNLFLWSAIMVLSFIVITGFQQKSSVPDVVRAKKFELVDDRGRVCAELGTADGITHLRLLNDEQTLIELTATYRRGSIEILGYGEKFHYEPGRKAGLHQAGSINLAVYEWGPMIYIADHHGVRLAAEGFESNSPAFRVFDRKGKQVVSLEGK